MQNCSHTDTGSPQTHVLALTRTTLECPLFDVVLSVLSEGSLRECVFLSFFSPCLSLSLGVIVALHQRSLAYSLTLHYHCQQQQQQPHWQSGVSICMPKEDILLYAVVFPRARCCSRDRTPAAARRNRERERERKNKNAEFTALQQ